MYEELGALTDARAEVAVLRPVRSGNAFEEAIERILQVIKLGVVTHGERLPPERDLAARLGVSRATIREALQELQQSGYVESRRGRSGGTFVTYRPSSAPRSEDVARRVAKTMGTELEDVLVLRSVLEVGAASAAASRPLDDDAREYLRTHLREADQAPSAEYRQMDSRFHLAVAEVAGSPSLASAVADARMRLNDLLDTFPLLDRNIRHSRAQHKAIGEAILAGDSQAARQAASEHAEATAALVRGFLAYDR